MIIGLVVALPEETRTLTAHPTGKGCRTFIAPSILLACSGAGPGNARASALSLLSEGAEGLVSWGCAAALDETLAPGDLTLADTLVSENGEKIDLRSDWLNDACEVLSELRPSVVCLAESKALVVDSSGKAQLHRQTGADILDMETVAVAKVALERNVPFLAVRAIADPVNMSLPLAVVHALNGDGEVELPRLFSYLLRHPGELPDLIRLGRYFNSAKKTLKQTARYLDSLTRTGRL